MWIDRWIDRHDIDRFGFGYVLIVEFTIVLDLRCTIL